MNGFKQRFLVARFEFLRQFTLRGDLIGLALVALVIAIKLGGQSLMESAGRSQTATIAIAAPRDALPNDASGRIAFVPLPQPEAAWRDALASGAIDGAIVPQADGTFLANVEKNPSWVAAAKKALTDWNRGRELAKLGMAEQQYKALGEPAKLDVRRTDGRRVFDDQATRSFSILLTVLSLVACASGCGLMFQTITGEKNHRVSEVVLSCIPAQVWIDGKVAAITLIGLKTILLYLFYITIGAAVLTERSGIVGSTGLLSFTTVAWVALFSLAGLVLWNSFFAAAAATASGDYGSARRTLILFPMIFYIVCFVGVDNPENWFMQALSFFPFSAAIAMPLRIVHGVVPLWQVLASLATLVAGAVAMRALAGAIFRTGMLLYGKSPSMFALARHLVFGPRAPAPVAIVPEPRGEGAP